MMDTDELLEINKNVGQSISLMIRLLPGVKKHKALHFDDIRPFIVTARHNFYIFPRQELAADGPSYEFLCQTTSIDFLARYQFDFNACIREGMLSLYCTPDKFWEFMYVLYKILDRSPLVVDLDF